VPADGPQQRPVPLVGDPSGRLGLYSSHLLVIDGQQGIDGRHKGDFTGYGTGFLPHRPWPSVPCRPTLLASTGLELTPFCNPQH
jgi:hypothetical protein